MPFTFSHPALVLPFLLKKRPWLSTSGLVAGSVVPDFEYFLRMRKGLSYYSHTWPGLFWFDLPFAVVLTVVFHLLVRGPLLRHLPSPFYARFVAIGALPWLRVLRQQWPVVVLSILIGALSHFGWDWFVHQSGDYLYQHQSRLFAFGEWEEHSQIYTAFHLSQSLLGLTAIVLFVGRLPAAPRLPSKGRALLFWLGVLLLTATTLALRLALGSGLVAEDILVSVLAAFLLALTVCAGLTSRPAVKE